MNPAPHPSTALAGAEPLFLIGCPRSGTTLFCRILNAHASILMMNETATFLQLARSVSRGKKGSPAGLIYGKQHHELFADFIDDRAKDLLEDYFAQLAEVEGKEGLKFWGEKHPHFSECLPFLQRHWPQAKYIYMVRDPRDSACSIAKMTNKPLEQGLEIWDKMARKYEPFYEALPEDRKVKLRYEDLVADYEGETSRVLQAFGLDLDQGILDYLKEFRDVDAHRIGPGALKGLKRFVKGKTDFQSKAVGRWEGEFGAAERKKAEKLCGDIMRKYGYARG